MRERRSRISERYELGAPIGRGGLGEVIRAYDRRMGCDVAIKALSVSGPEEFYRLKREFRVLSGIGHPNLVELYDLIVDEDGCFFTMELLDGQHFMEFVRGVGFARGDAPSALGAEGLYALRAALPGLAHGIHALHAAGRLHRDIKPENVRVTSGNRVVLLDFGLATETSAREDQEDDGFAGTPDYVSPEQAWGRRLSPATDWYGFGVMLYEALTGRLPFEGPPALTFVARTKPPKHPQTWLPGLDPALSELAFRLLDPSPEKRPSYLQILDCLGEKTADRFKIYGKPPFVGRSSEVAKLLDVVRKRSAAVVHIQGPSGIGKSSLVREAMQRIEEMDDAVLLRGRCHPSEEIPYRGLDGVIDSFCRWLLSQDGEAQKRPKEASALMRLFPGFQRVPMFEQAETDAPRFASVELRQRAIAALREMLSTIAEQSCVSIWIEDAHWSDDDSIGILADILRPPLPPKVAVILSYRSDPEAERQLAPLRGDDGLAWIPVHHLDLGPLARSDIAEMAAASQSMTNNDADERVDNLLQLSEGNPFFVTEALLMGDLRPKQGAERDPRSMVTRERIEMLPSAARRLLTVVAIAGRPMQRSVVFAAAGLEDAKDKGAIVAELRMQRMLASATDEGGAKLEIAHDRFRQAVLDDLTVEKRRSEHAAIVEALRRFPEADMDSMLDHLVAAGELLAARELVLEAALRAKSALAWSLAAKRLALAIAIGATGRPRHEIAEALAEALALSGRTAEAAQAYRDASIALSRAGGEKPPVLALLRAAAEQHLRGGEVEQGTSLLREVLEKTGVSWPKNRLAAITSILLSRSQISLQDPRRAQVSRREPDMESLRLLDAYWSAGLGLNMIDLLRSAVFQAKHAVLALRTGEPSHVARALATEISYRACEGVAKGSTAVVRLEGAATRIAKTSRSAETGAFVELCIGAARYFEGHFREAIRSIDEAEQVFRRYHEGITWEVANCWTYRFWSLSWLGELREMAALLPKRLAEIRLQRNRLTLGSVAAAHGNLLWLAADRPMEARARADEAIAPFSKTDFQSPHYFDLVARVRIDLYEGRGRDALHRIQNAWRGLGGSGLLRMRFFRVELYALRMFAALAAASEEIRRPSAFLRIAEHSVVSLSKEPHRMAKTMAALGRAGLVSFRGHEGEAMRSLAEAALFCERADLHLYGMAARLLLGQKDALSCLESQGVLSPYRFAAMLVPFRFISQPSNSAD